MRNGLSTAKAIQANKFEQVLNKQIKLRPEKCAFLSIHLCNDTYVSPLCVMPIKFVLTISDKLRWQQELYLFICVFFYADDCCAAGALCVFCILLSAENHARICTNSKLFILFKWHWDAYRYGFLYAWQVAHEYVNVYFMIITN